MWTAAQSNYRLIRGALAGSQVCLAGVDFEIPYELRTRLSIVLGNIRIHRLLDRVVGPGDTVVDVGAHIGYTAVYAAARVGASGRVIAIEPASDNVEVLARNAIAVPQLSIHTVAAGAARGFCTMHVRGDFSAVNSLFPESVYGHVTATKTVEVVRLDDVVDGSVRLVKIDVEGAEISALEGMPRLLAERNIHLIVEWHPLLQACAGQAPDALPRALWKQGFTLEVVSHTRSYGLSAAILPAVTNRLQRKGRSVELFAHR